MNNKKKLTIIIAGTLLISLIAFASSVQAATPRIGLVTNRILGWTNQRIYEMSGYTYEELEGQSAKILYPDEEEFLRVGREKHSEMRKKGIGTIETRWKHKNGDIIDIFLSSSPE